LICIVVIIKQQYTAEQILATSTVTAKVLSHTIVYKTKEVMLLCQR